MPPRISIVTTSFNRAAFLGEAIESVLNQRYSDLEYVIVDGGSTDGSAEIVRSYSNRLSWWISEPDAGQYHAINKGFSRTTGEIMAWLNSDDKYLPWTFAVVSDIFASLPEVEWLSTCFPLLWDGQGRAVASGMRPGFSRAGFLRGEYLPGGAWYSTGYLQQETTFWRRSLWERCGGRLDTQYGLAADFDLWVRFSHEAELFGVGTPLGGFRSHGNQRTATGMKRVLRGSEELSRGSRRKGGGSGAVDDRAFRQITVAWARATIRGDGRSGRAPTVLCSAAVRVAAGTWTICRAEAAASNSLSASHRRPPIELRLGAKGR